MATTITTITIDTILRWTLRRHARARRGHPRLGC
jgi:hypothetical protein